MTPPSCRVQRGAVTLVGAMFLIVTIIVMLGVAQRMAATDITDTALQSDAVEALFLAETGLERAAYRYANGTACAAIAGETDTAGRGSFLILTSVFIDPICRVRVEGSVMTTIAANTVTRTVEGDLKKSGFLGWAVGKRFGGALLLAWDGSAWSRPGPYPGVPNKDLEGVYCVTKDDCWAVGKKSGYELILHWDGSAWARLGPSNVLNLDLKDVYCFASDDCWAVGKRQKNPDRANINHWDGSTWSRVLSPAANGRDLESVYCVASNDCWAVGKKVKNPSKAENINHWDGSAWTAVVPNASVPNEDLKGVHCAASDDCWAVGKKSSYENINHWDGFTWTRVGPYGSVPNQELKDVNCLANGDCWAVGKRSGGENIDYWDGATWSRAGPYGSIPNQDLEAVHMVSVTEGYAVGKNGTIAAWDGGTWVGQASPVGEDLKSVSVVAGP